MMRERKFEEWITAHNEAEREVDRVHGKVCEVIEEAWRRRRARYDAFVGPEPARWRFVAHSEWKMRRASADFLTPSRTDIIDAAYHLEAIELIPKLMAAYTCAHREAS